MLILVAVMLLGLPFNVLTEREFGKWFDWIFCSPIINSIIRLGVKIILLCSYVVS